MGRVEVLWMTPTEVPPQNQSSFLVLHSNKNSGPCVLAEDEVDFLENAGYMCEILLEQGFFTLKLRLASEVLAAVR